MNKQTIKKLVPAVLSVLTAAGILCACQQSAPPDAQAGQGEQSLPVLKIGVQDVYGESGPAVQLLEKYGKDAPGYIGEYVSSMKNALR